MHSGSTPISRHRIQVLGALDLHGASLDRCQSDRLKSVGTQLSPSFICPTNLRHLSIPCSSRSTIIRLSYSLNALQSVFQSGSAAVFVTITLQPSLVSDLISLEDTLKSSQSCFIDQEDERPTWEVHNSGYRRLRQS